MEIKRLYQNRQTLQTNNLIHPNLADLVKAMGINNRYKDHKRNSPLSKSPASKQQKKKITIRLVDKNYTNCYTFFLNYEIVQSF